MNLRGLRVLVVGLGRFGGGVGVTRWLVNAGARVTVTDHAEASSLSESVAALDGCDVRLHLGGHDAADLDEADLVIVNPAVDKRRSLFFREIVRRGVPWTTEVNLFCERCAARAIGVTGTYGKSTTAAMLARALEPFCERGSGPFRSVHLGGNIGRSLLPSLDEIDESDVVVLELSSAQLEDLPQAGWAPEIAVITNLWPHHLDRYDSFARYVDVKLNIVGDPDVTRRIIVGPVDESARQHLATRLGDTTRVVSVTSPVPPVALRVPGGHNQTNAACVLAVLEAMGLSADEAKKELAGFPGLPHRLAFVRTIDGVDYYNDSKSTSPSATITALRSFDHPMVVIVGGQSKPVAPDEMARMLAARCRAVICAGQNGPAFAAAVRNAGGGDHHDREWPTVWETRTLDEAVAAAKKCARHGDIVLFSPGAPSFDAFDNFAQRGAAFVRAVANLA